MGGGGGEVRKYMYAYAHMHTYCLSVPSSCARAYRNIISNI